MIAGRLSQGRPRPGWPDAAERRPPEHRVRQPLRLRATRPRRRRSPPARTGVRAVSRSSDPAVAAKRTTSDASVPYQLARCSITSRSSVDAQLARRLDQPAFDVGDVGVRQRRRRRPAPPDSPPSSAHDASTARSAAARAVVNFTPTSEITPAPSPDWRVTTGSGSRSARPPRSDGRRQAVVDEANVVRGWR